jgi:hypothetical protein
MSEQDAIKWFKSQFGTAVQQACQGTPYSLDMVTAIAMQETYADCWGRLYQAKSPELVLRLCVGDTLDAPNRSAFPRTKDDLLAAAGGQQMFDVARQALLEIAQYNKAYAGAAQNPNKFCHGFGVFQYDIQHFRIPANQNFFLQRGWYDFRQCLDKLMQELNAALARAYPHGKPSLTDEETMYVAVAYNAGHVNVGAGPKQGYRDGSGVYYGENFQRYLAMAHGVAAAPMAAVPPGPPVVEMADRGATAAAGPQIDLGALIAQILALRGGLPKAQTAAAPAPQDRVRQIVDVLTALANASPDKLGPVNGALGQTVGDLLDGKKSAIGIIGSLIVQLLSMGGDTSLLGPIVKVLGGASGLTGVGLPIFLAMAAWGALGKLEKWSQAVTQPSKSG